MTANLEYRNPILEEREKSWGHPAETHNRIAKVWSGILNIPVTSYQVSLCMTGLKLVRAEINPEEPDSLNDADGYSELARVIMKYPELAGLLDVPKFAFLQS